jgi:hypothetical protein
LNYEIVQDILVTQSFDCGYEKDKQRCVLRKILTLRQSPSGQTVKPARMIGHTEPARQFTVGRKVESAEYEVAGKLLRVLKQGSE